MSDARREPILGRYLPLRTHAGGMGVVHVCMDTAERRAVAIKTFRPELLSDGALREAFLREAATWMRIGDHPHVVTARHVQREGEHVYVLCDLVVPPEEVKSPALRAWLGKPLPVAQVMRWALGIVRGMLWATTRVPGLVHRDLKPENVLVGRDREARVTDFGLAITSPTQADTAGTLAYMAPEQLQGRADARSDVYAFGLILLEMLTGRTGLDHASRAAIVDGHVQGRPQAHAAEASLPEALRPLVVACAAKDPAGRLADWETVEARLAAAWSLVVDAPLPAAREAGVATSEARELALWSELALANALSDLGRLADAAAGYDALLERARQAEARALEAAALTGLALVDIVRGDVQRALDRVDASLAIRDALGDAVGAARMLGVRAQALARLGKHEQALAGHTRSMQLFFELGRSGDYTVARFNTVAMLTAAGRFADAIVEATWCREAFRRTGDARAEGQALGSLGQAYRFAKQLDASLEASTAALACFRRVADRASEGRELSLQATTLRALGKNVEALDAFSAARAIAEEVGDRFLAGRSSYALAEMTPPTPRFAKLGLEHATRAAAGYRAAGREDLARDADALVARFAAIPPE